MNITGNSDINSLLALQQPMLESQVSELKDKLSGLSRDALGNLDSDLNKRLSGIFSELDELYGETRGPNETRQERLDKENELHGRIYKYNELELKKIELIQSVIRGLIKDKLAALPVKVFDASSYVDSLLSEKYGEIKIGVIRTSLNEMPKKNMQAVSREVMSRIESFVRTPTKVTPEERANIRKLVAIFNVTKEFS